VLPGSTAGGQDPEIAAAKRTDTKEAQACQLIQTRRADAES
jgi:hypothetical protein